MRYLLSCIFLPIALFANIIESMTIYDVDKNHQEETLVIYDLDNTLIQLNQLLGSDQWFYYRFKQLIEKLGDKDLALERAIAEWIAAQTLSKVSIVEEGSAELIKEQQERGIKIMGLTTRDCSMSMCTQRQLKELNIDLTPTAPSAKEHFFAKGKKGILFRNGVLYTSGSHKGECFRKFLELVDYKPKRVIFINDKYANIKEVADICYEDKIPFLGLRYGYLDEKIAKFDLEIAEIQMYNFGNILSDEEAYQIYLESQITSGHPQEEAILRATEE